MLAPDKRVFSIYKHQKGEWNTRISSTRNPLVRSLWKYLSYKRKGVDTIAGLTNSNSLVVDLGAGNGAYSFWFQGKSNSKVVAVDWSYVTLRQYRVTPKLNILRVCADMCMLPFKEEVFDFLYSVDALGHVDDSNKVLDESFRVTKPDAQLFIHSECSDYRKRWPDKSLITQLGEDSLALYDGHFNIEDSEKLYSKYRSRFVVHTFFSPAGILGWLLGYPEKYYQVFKKNKRYLLMILTSVFVLIKRLPLLGVMLRLCNSTTNHIEISLGLTGGGSCFSFMKKAK